MIANCGSNFLMCKRKERKFVFYILFFYYFFIFINNERKLRKMLKKLNIRYYSYQVTKQFYRMNCKRVLTVIL